MNKIILLLTLLTSCSPKEEISIFDSNMIMRSTSEAEEIGNKILEHKAECTSNKEEMENILKNSN